METLLAWLPLLVFAGIFIWLMGRSQREYRKHVADVNDVNRQIVDTNREIIAELQEIKQILKDRK